MNCEELKTSTRAYFESQLEVEVVTAYEGHLATCESCAGWVRVARETTCQHVADFLSEYLEGRLPGDQAQVFERHMHMCPPCLDYMEALKTTIAAGRKACEDEDRTPVPEALVQAILEAKRSS